MIFDLNTSVCINSIQTFFHLVLKLVKVKQIKKKNRGAYSCKYMYMKHNKKK